MAIRQVAVVGAGTMGAGIAQNIAQAATPVTLIDTSEERACRGKERIAAVLEEAVGRGILTEAGKDAVLGRIHPTGDIAEAASADLVVEAVFEDLHVKRDLFKLLGELCRADAILATNTSSLLVHDMAAETQSPERVVGLHYFYHPAKNRLVEVVGHTGSSRGVLSTAWAFQERIGKIPIASADAPGFVVNRFFVPWLNEAVRLLEEGLSIASIEAAAKQAFGIAMGPFALMNATGVPIAAKAAHSLAERLGDLYAPAPRLLRQVEVGEPWPAEGEADPQVATSVGERLWGLVFQIAATLVSEGVGSMDDTDLGARVGLRWPRGPFEEMNRIGVAAAAALAEKIEARYGVPLAEPLRRRRRLGTPFALSSVQLRVDDGIATITLQRPLQLNALNPKTIEHLEVRFADALVRDDVRAVVIAGSGKAFVAGADISYFVDGLRRGAHDEILAFAKRAQKLLRRIEEAPKRVICRLHGAALGGGAELALACHVVVATPQASMAFPETGLGIYPGLGGTQRLVKRLGLGLARWLLYTGATLTAERLAQLKLVYKVVAPEELNEALRRAATQAPVQQRADEIPEELAEIARFLAAADARSLLDGSLTLPGGEQVASVAKKTRRKAPLAILAVERLTRLAEEVDLDAGLVAESEGLADIFTSADALEGLSALLERRSPQFKGA